MANEGKLVYKDGDGRLAYKAAGDDAGQLAYKAAPVVTPGDITVAILSSQDEVGPIKSCGNVHNVRITFGGQTATASVSVVVAAATQTLSGSTASQGCSYPAENPPVALRVAAVQPSTGATATTQITIPNVATGAFLVTVTVDANGWLQSVSGQDQ